MPRTSQIVLLCAVFAVGVVQTLAADQRPTGEEWKKAKAEDDAKAADAAAAKSKMAAVDKVVTMLKKLKNKVLAEGEEEAASYNKFACFCKTGQKDKTKAIQEGTDEKTSLSAAIGKLAEGRKADDESIAELEKVIEETNDETKEAEKTNAGELKKYAEEKADLSSAIEAIGNALKTLKASKPSLVQLRSLSDTVRSALAIADALGLGGDKPAALLQQAPEVEMENYKFHSSGVIDTLEGLQKTFREKKTKSDEEEVKRLQEHDMLMQKNADLVKAKTLELENTQKAKADKIAEIAENSRALTIVSSTLLDDMFYLEDLYSMCKKKADAWDQRSKVRADELSAITAATTIIEGTVAKKTSGGTLRFAQKGVSVRMAEVVAHDDAAMEAIEADAEDRYPSSFLQRRSSTDRESPDETAKAAALKISQLFKSQGGRIQSTLLTSLASQITTGKPKGMEKIKTLIEELIKRLQAEAAAEATQKGWCDKSMGDANTKKVSTASAIDELNDSLAQVEANRNLLKEELAKLADEIKELEDAQEEADKLRKEEKTENEATVKEAKEGLEAVEEAIEILEKFYKAAAKEKASFSQVKGPEDDAPDAGFDSDKVYKGSQSEAGGVVGMLEVIQSDFVRTVKETEKAEVEAEQDHKQFTAETSTSLKTKEASEKAKDKEKSELDEKFDKQKSSLEKKTDLLSSTIEELLELKKSCVDTGMSYADRVARREEEIASLRKALCILTSFASYGPEAAEYDQC